jgi:hypothetical protein
VPDKLKGAWRGRNLLRLPRGVGNDGSYLKNAPGRGEGGSLILPRALVVLNGARAAVNAARYVSVFR